MIGDFQTLIPQQPAGWLVILRQVAVIVLEPTLALVDMVNREPQMFAKVSRWEVRKCSCGT